MAYRCDRCGKGSFRGHNVKHHRGVAGGQWKRKAPKTKKVSKPNLQTAWVVEAGQRVKKRLCTRCLKMVKKEQANRIATQASVKPKSALAK